jgi:hypothetical protein
MYSITEDELEQLHTAGNYRGIDLALFSVSIGSFITISATLATVHIEDARTNAIFWAAMLVALGGSIWFGFRSIVAWLDARGRLDSIKKNAGG